MYARYIIAVYHFTVYCTKLPNTALTRSTQNGVDRRLVVSANGHAAPTDDGASIFVLYPQQLP